MSEYSELSSRLRMASPEDAARIMRELERSISPLTRLRMDYPNEAIRTTLTRDGTEEPRFMMGQEHLERHYRELMGEDYLPTEDRYGPPGRRTRFSP